MCHATHEAQAFQQIVIDFEKRSGFFRVPGQRTRCEHAARMRGIERRRAISMRLSEDDGALRDDTVNVIDGARNELLEQIERLLVAEPIEPGPEFFGRMNLFHADAGGLRARLEQPGTGDARHEFPERAVVENVDEFGHKDTRFSGLRAHGQLVAKITDSGEAHAGDAEMLAEGGNVLHVKFVERDDAVDGLRPRGVAHRVDQALERQLFRHGENFIDTFEWPIGVAELFDGQEKHAAADRFASADEFLTLFEGSDTKDG